MTRYGVRLCAAGSGSKKRMTCPGQTMRALRGRLCLILLTCCVVTGSGQPPVLAAGITADAGLTPPRDRWIFRAQVRHAQREDDSSGQDHDVNLTMFPLVLAYGLRSDLTVIVRQMVAHREMSMGSADREDTGLGDVVLLTKYQVLRINRPGYVFGIAPTLGMEFPSGEEPFTSDTWDGLVGGYVSARRGAIGWDVNLEYRLNGLDDRDGDGFRPGDEFTSIVALAYQFSLDPQASSSFWPVLEIHYSHRRPDRGGGTSLANTGEDLLYVSPGMKFAFQSFIVEGLLQVPVYQDQRGKQMEQRLGGLFGIRYLF